MSISKLITKYRVEELKAKGVLIFDVDDTLLARRNGSAEIGQTFEESEAATLLPAILSAGIRVAIITGHGWGQLERRLVGPLIERLSNQMPDRLFVYANRGATRACFEKGKYFLDEKYNESFVISNQETEQLSSILRELASHLDPRADHPEISVRESVILSLRPILEYGNEVGSVREHLVELGNKLLTDVGLHTKFRVDAAGMSTIEITNRNISKSYACGDLFSRVGRLVGINSIGVSKASIIVGDEFGAGGNDEAIALNYPETVCISVATFGDAPMPLNVISVESDVTQGNIEASRAILLAILKMLD